MQGAIPTQQTQINELKTFCAQPSVAAENRGITEMANLVEQRLQKLGATTKQITVNNSKPFILAELAAKTNSDTKKTVLIYNHYDVQPEDPLDLWESSPFEPTIKDGKFYARGVADNKANLLVRIQGVEELLAENAGDLPVNIKWLIEGEEEIGSPNISVLQQEHGAFWQDCDVCIWESGGLNEKDVPELALGLKGALYVELTCEFNKSDLHSSVAAVVDSPVWRLVSALATLRDVNGTVTLDDFYQNVPAPTQAEQILMQNIDFNAEKYLEEYGAERALANPKNKVDFLTQMYFTGTANICGIIAGYTTPKGIKTVLPNTASVKIDFRLVPNQTASEIEAKLRKHLDKRGFTDIKITTLVTMNPGRTSIENEYIQKCIQVFKQEYGVEPVVPIISLAGGPIYGIASVYDIPVVRMGCAYANCKMHAPNENIRLTDYFKSKQVFKTFLNFLA